MAVTLMAVMLMASGMASELAGEVVQETLHMGLMRHIGTNLFINSIIE